MAKKVIQLKKEDPLPFSDEINALMMKGRYHGFISSREFLQVMPEIENNIKELDEVFDYMFSKGVEMKEVKDINFNAFVCRLVAGMILNYP